MLRLWKEHSPVSFQPGQSEILPTHEQKLPRSMTNEYRVALLTAGRDKPYALGLAASLISQGVGFDFIGSDYVNAPELHQNQSVRFLNLRGDQRSDASLKQKVWRILVYYARLLQYASTSTPRIFHILWNNKFDILDRTLLPLYYRFLGKRIVLTVHNVNVGKRDRNDSVLNRLTLKLQYRLSDHLFVHTEQMKRELQSDFRIAARKISVIPFGINSTVPNTALTSAAAKKRLGLSLAQKAVLFFGHIAPYKGLEFLVKAIELLAPSGPDYRLIIAGRPKGWASYWEGIERQISNAGLDSSVVKRIEYVPDEETEVFFKAADVCVIPYTHIFQSGVLFLSYNFGLPVIASDVGSLREDIVEGQTGFVFKSQDSSDLAKTLQRYFGSELFRELENHRPQIREYAQRRYSWNKVAEITTSIYSNLLAT
jgi:glycosyltransferase involved in cell wall biosynthesis